MRIISGKYKGKRLMAPKKLPVRPTTDMAKEALFNILNNSYYFENIRVLDLFSGTGNISYEFASRGCQNITAVEKHFACIKFINKTAQEMNFPIQTIKSDVLKFLNSIEQKYDVIFADPPYDFSNEQFFNIASKIFEKEMLLPAGVFVLEHSKHTDLTSHPNLSYQRRYGGNIFSFFEA